MSITIGQQVGSYEITALLGKGGMGEVYRARDTKLKREVAIKFLPDEFSRDPTRVSRFQREAEVLASLNHPNIAAIYDLDESNDTRFLVLELVEGQTLAERIQRGRIPVEEALGIAHQIAEAFEAAHEKGVIHRDLKPANVKITPEGKLKVLDFGLAKAMSGANASATARSQGMEGAPHQSASNSPTILTAAATNGGMVLGTAGYMSPEQARGHAADQRSDIFSFGCVLYEMLTGRQTFSGETVADVIASVMAREPEWQALPTDLHPEIESLIRRCIAKNRKDRWHAIADVRVELETITADPHGLKFRAARGLERRPLWKRAIPIAIAAVLAAAGTNTVDRLMRPAPPSSITRFSVVLPAGARFSNRGRPFITISPDGANIAYTANEQLFVRSLSDTHARAIQGAVSSVPFFSADSQWLGFVSPSATEGNVKKIPVAGGSAVTICAIPQAPFGISWSADDQIFIGQGPRGILRVFADGGKPETIVTVKPGEAAYGPELLPGGEFLMFTLAGTNAVGGLDRWDKAQIVAQSLKTGERRVLIETGADARYVPTGHIVYAADSTVLAVAFDASGIKTRGGPAVVIDGVQRSAFGGTAAAQFAFSSNGSMVYVQEDVFAAGDRALALVDRTGGRRDLEISQAGRYNHPRISPVDGKQLAFQIEEASGQNIWIYDLTGTTLLRRLTFEGTNNNRPTWMPDGKRLVFTSNREGNADSLFWQSSDGGPAELLLRADPGNIMQPEWWSAVGQLLTFALNPGGGSSSIWMLPSGADQKPKLLIKTQHGGAANSSLSPDGKWLAYWSNETGRNEVYVQSLMSGAKHQISTTGTAHYPLWSPDGKQLFYIIEQPGGTGQIVSVDVRTQPSFAIEKITRLPIEGVVFNGPRGYDITPDGKNFVVMFPKSQTKPDTASTEQINVTINWFEELKQRVPTK